MHSTFINYNIPFYFILKSTCPLLRAVPFAFIRSNICADETTALTSFTTLTSTSTCTFTSFVKLMFLFFPRTLSTRIALYMGFFGHSSRALIDMLTGHGQRDTMLSTFFPLLLLSLLLKFGGILRALLALLCQSTISLFN